ncbi:MAG: hypothetical protein ABSB15_10985 [Bryobacteraceae bacterium]|jgi:hypothetical protein
MKSGSVRLALCAVFALTSPLIVFAGGQPARVFMPSKADMQNVTGAARAIQQGKGSGMTRSQAAEPASAPRTQTPAQTTGRPGDTAFTK